MTNCVRWDVKPYSLTHSLTYKHKPPPLLENLTAAVTIQLGLNHPSLKVKGKCQNIAP